MKLWLLVSDAADYDELRHAVVWADDPDDARLALAEANLRADGEEAPCAGAIGFRLAGPYMAIEIEPQRGVVLAEAREG